LRSQRADGDGGPEVAQVLAEQHRSGRSGDGRKLELRAADAQAYALETPVAKSAARERRDRALGGIGVCLERRSLARHLDPFLPERGGRGARELERVDLLAHGVVAAGLDPGGEGELVDQLAELRGRRRDHPDVAGGCLVELDARERVRKAVDRRQRGAQVVAREYHEVGEAGVVCHVASVEAMPESGELLTHDLQASPSEVPLALSRAGVGGVQKAIRIRYGENEKLIAAEIDCTVDLEPGRKGVHMSRFPELFEEAIEEVVIGEALLVENLAEHIAAHIVERQRALRAEVRIVARYPVERETPVTRLPTQEIVSLIGVAAASSERTRRLVGVEATGINACPCAQGLVREQAAARLGEAGFGDLDVKRILELVPLATHNQRGRGTLFVGTDTTVNAEQLIRIVEGSMSSPVYELLKRPDELFVVEHAHLQPRFVEDSVRIALRDALAAYPGLDNADFLLARQVNLETIHSHDVIAERYGTVGELRGELEGGRPAERHTELREWLT
jgi:GTP cyclohydrolase-4